MNSVFPKQVFSNGAEISAKNTKLHRLFKMIQKLCRKSVGYVNNFKSLKRKIHSKKSSGILCKGNKIELYQFISANKAIFGLR